MSDALLTPQEWEDVTWLAVEGNRPARLRELLAVMPAGQSLDARNDDEHTMLMVSSWFGRAETCELLLAAGASPSLRAPDGCTAAIFARFDTKRVREATGGAGFALFETYLRGVTPPSAFEVRILRAPTPSGRARKMPKYPKENLDGAAAAIDRRLASRTHGLPRPSWSYDHRHGLFWLLPEEAERARIVIEEVLAGAVGGRGYFVGVLAAGDEDVFRRTPRSRPSGR